MQSTAVSLLERKISTAPAFLTATRLCYRRRRWMYTSIPSDEETTPITYKQTTVSGYQALEVQGAVQDCSEPSPTSTTKQRWIVVTCLIVASILIFTSIVGLTKTRSMPEYSSTKDESRACSFAECQRTMCDPKIASFVCVSGMKPSGIRKIKQLLTTTIKHFLRCCPRRLCLHCASLERQLRLRRLLRRLGMSFFQAFLHRPCH